MTRGSTWRPCLAVSAVAVDSALEEGHVERRHAEVPPGVDVQTRAAQQRPHRAQVTPHHGAHQRGHAGGVPRVGVDVLKGRDMMLSKVQQRTKTKLPK